MDLLQALVEKGILPKGDIKKISAEAESSGLTLEEVLVKYGISGKDILTVKGEYFDVPTKSLEDVDVAPKILDYIPEDSASHYRFVPLQVADGVLEVGMTNPDDIEAKDALNFISSKVGMPFKIFLITETDFNKIFSLYKGLSGEVSRSLSELETEIKAESK